MATFGWISNEGGTSDGQHQEMGVDSRILRQNRHIAQVRIVDQLRPVAGQASAFRIPVAAMLDVCDTRDVFHEATVGFQGQFFQHILRTRRHVPFLRTHQLKSIIHHPIRSSTPSKPNNHQQTINKPSQTIIQIRSVTVKYQIKCGTNRRMSCQNDSFDLVQRPREMYHNSKEIFLKKKVPREP